MAGERYKHIFLPGPNHTQPFTNPRQGSSAPRIRDRDRIQHAQHLQRCFEKAWAEFEKQRKAVVQVDHLGAYIEFAGEPNFDLVVKSLESRGSGIRLLNVHHENQNGLTTTFATVFVPHEKRGHFLRKINAYSKQETKSHKPKNKDLIDSISDIHLAVLESFWCSDERALIPGKNAEWVEVWLSSDLDRIVSGFEALLKNLNIKSAEGSLRFPERSVKLIQANRNQLEQLIEFSDDIAELRLAKKVASFYLQLENREQVEMAQNLLKRCRYDKDSDVFICILDTGVNRGHLLLQSVIDEADLHTVRPEWGAHDHEKGGHGTLMAGTAIYGDLLDLLNETGTIHVQHRLESAKILPPPPEMNLPKLWGDVTAQGISRAEIQGPERKRIVCLSVTATDNRDRGRPSSWSGAVDALASGYHDGNHRFIVVSAGNIEDSKSWLNYPHDNLTNEIHDPGQAWNALTVGAFTEKTLITDQTLRSWEAVAPVGGLSPYSTTSATWPRKWPIKPEVVFEGGNVARGPNNSISNIDDLQLLSLSHDPQVAQFAPFNATSAACAQAARMAAQIQAQYPEAWPETLRALIVHSADWTDTMREQFLQGDTKGSRANLLRICGYGKPNLEKALYCLSNSLTLISQTMLQPFNKIEARYVTWDMHLYNLPWPQDVLLELGETQVSMRVTLSYFVEPGPGEIGWKNRYRYASHALRFKVNGPGESESEFIRRVNKQARDDEEAPDTEGIGKKWLIGSQNRNVGSIHSDTWQGPAVELSRSNLIAVYPAVGWWRERNHLNRWDRKCRYSLVVSIYAPEQAVDIYTPVAVKVGIVVPISIPIN
ncbi:MAG: S8 family peptidase [Desulfobacteraceae bacterium]|nr:MAG: S8 family peptidase [Desulfobacteraceae bacterium]